MLVVSILTTSRTSRNPEAHAFDHHRPLRFDILPPFRHRLALIFNNSKIAGYNVLALRLSGLSVAILLELAIK